MMYLLLTTKDQEENITYGTEEEDGPDIPADDDQDGEEGA